MTRFAAAAVALVLWAGPAPAQIPERFQDTIGYVKALQTPSGGYRPAEARPGEKAPEPTLRATSAAVRAIKYLGGGIPDKQKTAAFVDRCFDPETGGFSETPGGKPDVTSTAVGVMAAVALGMPLEKYRGPAVQYLSENSKAFPDIRLTAGAFEALKEPAPKAKAWLAEIEKLRNPDGTYGKGADVARMTGGAAAAVLRLGGKLDNRAAVLKAIRDGQRNNGAYGTGDDPVAADLQSSYYVMRALHMLRELPPDAEALRTFVEKCRNNDGGYSNAPDEPSNVSATYFAAILHYWLKED